MLSDFVCSFRNIIKGTYVGNSISLISETKVKQELRKMYEEFMAPDYKCSAEYSDNLIENVILTHQNDQIEGFTSINSFLSLMTPQM
jgi:hypothetical protein